MLIPAVEVVFDQTTMLEYIVSESGEGSQRVNVMKAVVRHGVPRSERQLWAVIHSIHKGRRA